MTLTDLHFYSDMGPNRPWSRRCLCSCDMFVGSMDVFVHFRSQTSLDKGSFFYREIKCLHSHSYLGFLAALDPRCDICHSSWCFWLQRSLGHRNPVMLFLHIPELKGSNLGNTLYHSK